MSDEDVLLSSSCLAFPSTRSGDLFEDCQDLLADQPSMSSQHAGLAPTMSLPAPLPGEIPESRHEPVQGREELMLAMYTEDDLMSNPRMRARTVVLNFPKQSGWDDPLEKDFFIRRLIHGAYSRRSLPGSYGFMTKMTSHFEGSDQSLYVVVVSKQPLRFDKWSVIRGGLDATHIHVLHLVSKKKGATQPGLRGVSELFKSLTTIEELTHNRVVYPDSDKVCTLRYRFPLSI